jgi:hypothetical protein
LRVIPNEVVMTPVIPIRNKMNTRRAEAAPVL